MTTVLLKTILATLLPHAINPVIPYMLVIKAIVIIMTFEYAYIVFGCETFS